MLPLNLVFITGTDLGAVIALNSVTLFRLINPKEGGPEFFRVDYFSVTALIHDKAFNSLDSIKSQPDRQSPLHALQNPVSLWWLP